MEVKVSITVDLSTGTQRFITQTLSALFPVGIAPQAFFATDDTRPSGIPAAEPKTDEKTVMKKASGDIEVTETAAVTETPKKAEKPEKPLTATDVRAAMHECRLRLEGADYETNTEGEAYKKYHRALTAKFKEIAAQLGAEKPSALTTEEAQKSFIQQVNGLTILEGVIQPKLPF